MSVRAHIEAVGSLVLAAGALAAILRFGPEPIAALMPEGAADPLQEALFALAIFGAMIVVALIAGAILRRNVVALGARPLGNAAIGAGLGLLGIALAIGYAAIAGTLHGGGGAAGTALLWGAVLVLFQASAEEIYFRGWLQPALARAWGVLPAIGVTALAFAVLHFVGGARAPLAFVNLLLGGLLFGTLAVRSGGLAGAIGAHFAWNASEQLVFGLDPNPGLGSFGALLDLELAGAALWGGSEEGLNASVAMALALVVLLVPLAILARRPRTTR